MMQHPALDILLADAVGDDPALVAELRAAFLAGADAQVARLAVPGERADAAARLKGLAGSFGALALMDLAGEVAGGCDTALIDRIQIELALLGE